MTADNELETGQGSRELLERKLARSRRMMRIEAAWPRLWLPVAVAVLFVLASMAGLWPLLSPTAHGIGLGLFALALILACVPLLRLPRPERGAAIRWLERRSRLPHRPASTLDDQLAAASDETSRALWRAHLARMRRHVEAMRPGWPRPDIARFDPYALRVPLLLALFAALGLAPHRLAPGLAEAFSLATPLRIADLRLDAWIAPPAYTGAGQVMLADGGKPDQHQPPADILVPQHSELVVRVWGPDAGEARLELQPPAGSVDGTAPSAGAEAAPASPVKATRERDVQDMRVKLDRTTTAELTVGGSTLASWPIGVSPDNAPAIVLTEPPAGTARSTLRLSYRIADDFGVAEARARITRPGQASAAAPAVTDLSVPIGEPPDFALTLPKAAGKRGNARTYSDLTGHPWAGLPVEVRLTARDEAGNEGASEAVGFTLPERNFTKPLAKAIIALRRALVDKPVERLLIAPELDALSEQVGAGPDPLPAATGIYLGLRSAYWRLLDAQDRDAIRSIVDQLWEIALTIEDGNISQAERELRAAQDRLMDALAHNASPEELEKLMKELRQALGEFLKAMAQSQPQSQDAQQQGGDQQTISAKQLDEMLKNIESMAKTGARDAARQMLSQLRDMLENLSRGGQPQQSAGDQQMRRSLDELGKMIMDQRKLMDETHRSLQQQGSGESQPAPGEDGEPQPGAGPGPDGQQGQQGMNGQRSGQRQGQGRGQHPRQGAGAAGSGELQQRQGELLNDLNGLLDKLNSAGASIPDDLMRAGSDMGRAERELGDEQLGSAETHQGQALDSLRKGAQALAEEMMKNRAGRGGQAGRDSRDPLGRPQRTSGPEFGDDVKVPDQIDTQRARDILEELRRRASEAKRPAEELEYLDRLIQQF
jgi:uncharacterized protein (TIGR02302 family)